MSGQHGSLLGGGAAPTTAWISAFSTLPHTPSFPTSTGHLPLPSAFSTAGGAARGTIGGRQLDFPSLHAADGLAPPKDGVLTGVVDVASHGLLPSSMDTDANAYVLV
ncbi:hypothetical protein OsJ_27065 [Oryza sativa Japonica Group]|uniref:Uncharacterized protein n=1 Tax=Oryza sativa subsp. japonica TaxID=39947 RepID=A3BSG0_ORYSJ|nr:hypothetical protein OsJ_27065 [Oryza sativa Japonica Group]